MSFSVVFVDRKGMVVIPVDFSGCSALTIRTPWRTEVRKGKNVVVHHRHASVGDKPYVPEGFIEFKLPGRPAKRYVVKQANGIIQ